MKSIIILVVFVFGAIANANCSEISATITKTSSYTIITCSPQGDERIEKAYLSLYPSVEQPLSFSQRKMNVTYANEASYILRGVHDNIEGNCAFILVGNKAELREDFLASIN